MHPAARRFVSVAAALIALAGTARAAGDARSAVEAFVGRLGDVQIRDLIIDQTLTLYRPDGLQEESRGQQRVLIKVPGRQRLEQTIEGRREVRLLVNGRVWIRRADGKTHEAPPPEADRDPTRLLVPLRRAADEVLAEWRSLGVRDGVSAEVHVGGRLLTLIGARPGDRESPAVWLDPEYGVVRFITREKLPKRTALLDLAFSEHRPLLGRVYFPYRQEAFVDGKLLMLITVRSLVANTDPADELFDPQALQRER